MTWFKVDDRLHSHPKALKAGLEAMGLWTLTGSYCATYETDGLVPRAVADRLAGGSERASRLAGKLVAAGLWDATDDGDWQFHDWHDFQPTRAELAANREKRSSSGKIGGLKSAEVRKQTVKQVLGESLPQKQEMFEAKLNPVPSRPDPREKEIPLGPPPGEPTESGFFLTASSASESGSQPVAKPGRTRRLGSRIVPDWQPSESTIEWAHRKDVDIGPAIERFVNHWLAASGPNSVKADWQAAFKGWVALDIENGRTKSWSEKLRNDEARERIRRYEALAEAPLPPMTAEEIAASQDPANIDFAMALIAGARGNS